MVSGWGLTVPRDPFTRRFSASILTSVSLRINITCAEDEINYLIEMCSGSEEGSYSRLAEFCITQL